MAKKKVDESPYRQYSIEEVAKVETGNYVIQVGGDLFSYNGKMAFSKEKAEMYYENVLAGLNDMKENGSDLEKEDAEKCLLLLRIYPLRIH